MSDYKQLLEELPCPCCGLKKTENARLKELNREMVEALKEIKFEYKEYGRIMGKTTVEKMEEVLTKVEVQGE